MPAEFVQNAEPRCSQMRPREFAAFACFGPVSPYSTTKMTKRLSQRSRGCRKISAITKYSKKSDTVARASFIGHDKKVSTGLWRSKSLVSLTGRQKHT